MEKQLEYNISLERLTLNNFRCFGELEVNFDERLTVFIAENGGGKTSILEAIAETLKFYLAALKVTGYNTKLLPRKDVKVGQFTAYCNLLTDMTYMAIPKKAQEEEQTEEEPIYQNENIRIDISTSRQDMEEANKNFFSKVVPIETYPDVDLPVLVYYDGNSVKTEYRERESTSFAKLDMVYNNALNGERFSLTTFYNWWKLKEDKLLRIPDRDSPEYKTIDSQFTTLKAAAEFLLNDNEELPMYTNLRINENLVIGMDKNTYKENGELEGSLFVELTQFSAGEKSLFAFVADLGLRLLYATPLRSDRQRVIDVAADGKLGTIAGKGIALIDEIDLHLHPKWQRKVIDKLLKIFPDIQFVITTHSPGTVQNVPKESIRVLSDGKLSEKQLYTRGRDIESIYFDAFGQEEYPREQKSMIDKLRNFYDIIDDNEQLPKAKQIIEDLKEEWGPKDKKIIELETLYDLANQDLVVISTE